jgi:hypothetical protein
LALPQPATEAGFVPPLELELPLLPEDPPGLPEVLLDPDPVPDPDPEVDPTTPEPEPPPSSPAKLPELPPVLAPELLAFEPELVPPLPFPPEPDEPEHAAIAMDPPRAATGIHFMGCRFSSP